MTQRCVRNSDGKSEKLIASDQIELPIIIHSTKTAINKTDKGFRTQRIFLCTHVMRF